MKRFIYLFLLFALPLPAFAVGIEVAAVVNDQVISTLDVNDRVALLIGTTGMEDTEETRARIKPQVSRMLVDEALQVEEAARQGITATDEELQDAIGIAEKRSGKPPGSLMAALKEHGLPEQSFYNQVRAQVLWSKVMVKRVRGKVRISDEEVKRASGKMARGAGSQEVQIETILLPVDSPANEAGVRALAEKLAEEIKSGVNFSSVATQFASGAAQLQEPIWVNMNDLDTVLARTVKPLAAGEVAGPVRSMGGYQIVRLLEKREASASTPDSEVTTRPQAEMALKQVVLKLKDSAPPKEADVLLEIARGVSKNPGTCLAPTIAGIEDLGDLDIKVTFVRDLLSRFSEAVRGIVEKLPVGGVSEPFATPQGIQFFMLCERIDLPDVPVTRAAPVADEQVRQKLFAEKMELEAQKYLRNMRRDAFIEIR